MKTVISGFFARCLKRYVVRLPEPHYRAKSPRFLGKYRQRYRQNER